MKHITTEIYPDFEMIQFVISFHGIHYTVSTYFKDNKFTETWEVDYEHDFTKSEHPKILPSSNLYSNLKRLGKFLLAQININKAIELSNLCQIHKINICRYR